jgi:hypothetical protein
MAASALSLVAVQDKIRIAAARLTPKYIFMAISYGVSARVLLTMSVDYIGAVAKKQARDAGLLESCRETRRTGFESAPVTMVVVMMMPVMRAMRPPMAMMIMVGSPVAVMMVMPPLHVGGQLAGVALRARCDARTDRGCRLRLLRGSRDNQECAQGGESENLLQMHVDLHGRKPITTNCSRWFHLATMRAMKLEAAI